MKSSTLSITFAAMIMVAAFAGIMLVADDASAGSGAGDSGTTPEKYIITFQVTEGNSTTRTIAASDGTFIAPSLADLGLVSDKDLVQWKLDDAVFKPGQEYTLSALGTDATQGIVSVRLVAELDETVYVTFIIDEQSFKCPVGDDSKLDQTSEQFKAMNEVYSAIGKDSKVKVDGWFKDGTGKAVPITFNSTTFKENASYTLKYSPIYSITFVVDDVVVASCTTANFKPPVANPSKDNYNFVMWALEDGTDVGDVSAWKIPELDADTVIYAVFEPVQLTVTLVIGDVVSVQTALYNQIYAEPKLPGGYSHWATMELVDDKEVYTEFDFSQPIYEDIVLYAQEVDPSTIYNVTFEIEGKAVVIQKSDSIVIPNPSIDGKVFKGWVVKGESNYVDPATYDYTADVTFVAIYDKAPAPAGPAFFKTTAGQCTAVIIAVLIIALVYAVYTNMFGMKDFLTSFKVQRVKK